jgi:phosphosulfolactate synthase (CoM biosynthesis protein A)
MATPQLAPGKKRYSVTLTQANVDRFQNLAKSLGLPSTAMSNIFDLAIVETTNLLQTLKDKGTLTISDLMKFSGQQLELIIEEERRTPNDQERKKAPGRSKVAKRGN